jgi:hypothetical protein
MRAAMSDVTFEIAMRASGSASEYGCGIRPPVHDVRTAAAARTEASGVRHCRIGSRPLAHSFMTSSAARYSPVITQAP